MADAGIPVPSPSSVLDVSTSSALISTSASPLSSLVPLAPAITASLSGLSGFANSHLPPPPVSPPKPTSMVGWIGWVFSLLFQGIPSLLYWIITFSTITLPTWLFTLFSMSLTFTMNFTTL